MEGRIIILFSLAFVLGCVVSGIAATFSSSVFLPAAILAAIPLTLIATLVFSYRKSPCTMMLAAALCGFIAGQSGGLHREDFTFFEKAENAKSFFSSKLDRLFDNTQDSEAETAVLKALLLGDKSSLDKSLKTDYKKSGAMHLLALSGLHIGIIYTFLAAMLSILGNSLTAKRIKRILSLTAIWVYAVLTGLSSSISRAVLMITVYEVGAALGSGKDLLRALSISAFLTVIANPSAPFEIGFQLSYSAVLSIIFIYPELRGLLQARSVLLRRIWDTLSISIACQAATAPFALIYFGSLPKNFMLTNLLAIPVTGMIMYSAPFALALSPFTSFGISLLHRMLALLNIIIKLVAGI